jgi:uncharacterized protein (TIGR00266 family)
MKYRIDGTVMQTLCIELEQSEQVYSQTHALAWMNDRISMDTHTGGGLMAGIMRGLSGGSLFITDFTAEGKGEIAFAPRFPGTIMARTLAADESLICRRETFLCAEKSVELEVVWQYRLGVGIFGGMGLVLQRVTGPGTVWLDLSGEVVHRTLGEDDRLLVHVGHVGVHEPSVAIDLQVISGFRNIVFGGDGLFLAELRGPGDIWLQSMPIINLAEEIARHLPGR